MASTSLSAADLADGEGTRHPETLCAKCRELDLGAAWQLHQSSIPNGVILLREWTREELVNSTRICGFCAFLHPTFSSLERLMDAGRPKPKHFLPALAKRRIARPSDGVRQEPRQLVLRCLAQDEHGGDSALRDDMYKRPLYIEARIQQAQKTLSYKTLFLNQISSEASASNAQSPVSPHSSRFDEVDIRLIKSWLRVCELEHQDTPCQLYETSLALGLRVMDCDTGLIIQYDLAQGQYVALSYLWGPPKPSNSTVDSSELKTIIDARKLTITLGFKYLWVDRYCIPQDDAYLKHIQIQNMDKVYSGAVLTIVAAAGDGPERGLPGVNGTPRSPQRRIFELGGFTIEDPDWLNFRSAIDRSKWNSRGWTFQEGVLAKRRLVCTDKQMYFQCQSAHFWESVSARPDTLGNVPGIAVLGKVFPTLSTSGDLYTCLREYSKRELSYPMDTLDAFAGVLNYFRRTEHCIHHLTGLPLFPTCPHVLAGSEECGAPVPSPALRLCLALAWSSPHASVRLDSFPSWSWAGWRKGGSEPRNIQSTLRFPHVSGDLKCGLGDSCTLHPYEIELEFNGGERQPWDLVVNQLAEPSFQRKRPLYLHITSWTFQAQLRYQEVLGDVGSSRMVWELVVKQKTAIGQNQMRWHSYMVPDEISLLPSLGKVQEVMGLVLYHNWSEDTISKPPPLPNEKKTRKHSLGFLFLIPDTNKTTFTRVGFMHMDRMFQPSLAPALLSWDPVESFLNDIDLVYKQVSLS